MNLKIMVTGRNRRIAADICEHITAERNYTVIKCAPTKSALYEMSLAELPHVVIICAGDETKDSIKAYDVLREIVKIGALEIIIVTNDEDRKVIINNTRLSRMYFMARPVSITALYRKLSEIEELFKDDLRDGGQGVVEYINEKPVPEFEKRHILIVDDDPEQLMMIKEHLSEFYEVTLVNSGKNAFKALGKYRIDLILLDYMMPEMDGPRVLLSLREKPEYRDIPIIFLTGVSEKETVLKTLVELKPQGYVLKPTRKSELVAKIIDVIDKTAAGESM